MIELFTKLVWAAIGAAAGYYVAKRQLHDYYEERLKKETEEAQYFYKEKYDAKLEAALNKVVGSRISTPNEWDPEWEKSLKGDSEDAEPDNEDYSEGLLSDEAAEALTNYQGISTAPSILAQEMAKIGDVTRQKVSEAVAIEENSQEAEEIDLAAMINSGPGPRLINFTMFDENEPNYAQTTVVYFKDGVVVDEHDEKVSEETVKKHIGDYNLEQVGEHRPTIYVRNDRFKMDFEIVWDRNTYEKSVLGKKG